MEKVEAVPIKVDKKLYTEIKQVSNETGVPAARIIREALKDWLKVVAPGWLESVNNKPSLGNLINFETAKAKLQ